MLLVIRFFEEVIVTVQFKSLPIAVAEGQITTKNLFFGIFTPIVNPFDDAFRHCHFGKVSARDEISLIQAKKIVRTLKIACWAHCNAFMCTCLDGIVNFRVVVDRYQMAPGSVSGS